MRTALALVLLALGACAAFWPALSAGFVNWDDPEAIADNAQLRGVTWEHVRWMFTTCHTGPYQPLSWLTLALDGVGEASGAPSAARVHATSIALHIATAMALFFVARKLFRGVASEHTHTERAALFAAALFAIHPLRCESVVWATERRDVLYGLFTVLTLGAWLRWAASEKARITRRVGAREWGSALALAALCIAAFVATTQRPSGGELRFAFAPLGLVVVGAAFVALSVLCGRGATRWYGLALVAFAAALLAKGAGMTLAAVLLVLDVWPLKRERDWRGLVFEKLPFAVLGVVFGVLAMWGQAALPEALASWSDHTLVERMAQAFYGLAFYPLKTFAPVGLSPIYELPEEISFRAASFASSALAVVVVLGASIALRKRSPAPLVALSSFALLVAPLLGFAQVGPQLVADRYSYVPCIPLALLAAGALFIGTQGVIARVAPSIALICVASLGALTYRRTQVWRDSATLWGSVIAVHPDSYIANAGLGDDLKTRAFAERDNVRRAQTMTEAAACFERALHARAEPKFCSNLSVIFQELARLDAERASEHATRALDYARRAVELAQARGSDATEHLLALGSALLAQGAYAEALATLERYTRERPEHALGWANLGLALTRAQRPLEGLTALRRATQLRPLERSFWWFQGEAAEQLGDRASAREAYERVLRIEPSHADAAAKLRALQNDAARE